MEGKLAANIELQGDAIESLQVNKQLTALVKQASSYP